MFMHILCMHTHIYKTTEKLGEENFKRTTEDKYSFNKPKYFHNSRHVISILASS